MAKEKKGAKFGRHSRNPSSKLYTVNNRRERNKRLKVERFLRDNPNAAKADHAPGKIPTFPPKPSPSRVELRANERVMFTSPVKPQAGLFLTLHNGVILEISDTLSDCIRAKGSYRWGTPQIFHREGAQLIPVLVGDIPA